MANCLNCRTKLSCGCQKKTASDGKSVCKSCIKSYEAGLKKKNKKTATDNVLYGNAPIILSVKAEQKDN